MSENQSGGNGVKSARRALAILELLSRADRPLTFAEIGAALGYPRSSLFSLLKTLQDRQWLELDGDRHAYRLGVRTLEAGTAYLRSIDLVRLARPHMESVRDVLDETVQLAVLDGRYNVYLAKVDGAQRLRLASAVGRRLEAHATALGKMLLAGLADDEFDRLLAGVALERFTPRTITDLPALKRDVAAARRRGYAIDNEEHTRGVRCVAVPIHDYTGRTVAAISVSFPTVRFSEAKGNQARALLLEAGANISRDLGYRTGPGADRQEVD